ncbi:SDR family oxidoreductase [uncultured Arcticibacterium sp.]|uniref:SDR family oxidoreductase n=1 Tax=uncultured Arcticibacterium sp. TaxID=2173042 RepID=UPI0030FA7249
MNNLKNVLVAGANGSTGRSIVNLLKKSETYEPIAMVRKQDQKDYFENQGVKSVLADLEQDLDHAMINVDKVIFAAGSKGGDVIAVDQDGAKKLTNAAKQSGVEKFVMLSSMGADNPEQSNNLQDYLRAKQNADDHLLNSGLNYSIVRPGQLTNGGATGKIQLDEKIKTRGSISREDVAKTLVQVLDGEVKQNQVFEIISGDVPIAKAVYS